MKRWSRARLDQCTEIVSGATPDTAESSYWNGEICWATPKDLSELQGSQISNTARKITRAGLERCAATILPVNSVLFSSRAPIGHVAINSVPMATNQGFKSFVPKPDRLLSGFLYHWLRENRPYLESLGTGATFKEVSKAVVSRVEIPLPPIDEQRRITEVLDKADALRAKRRAALAKLDELTQSIFLDMFGDPALNVHGFREVELGSITRAGDQINYGVVQPGSDSENGVPLIRVGDLLESRVSHASLKRIDPQIERSYRRSRLRGDEILVSCVGSIGTVALADSSVAGFNIARAVARIPLAASISREFIAAQLKSESVQRYFLSELRTVSQPTLNIKQLAETKLMLPPESAQRGFEQRASTVEGLRVAQKRSLALLDALFASLQHRAFRGDL